MATSLLSTAVRRLEGKVAIITGGASGFGECTAGIFAKHGAKVIIADIQDELANSVCKNLGHESASFVHCDVTKESDVANAVDTAVSRYGKLDIMFNNAGIHGNVKHDISECDFSDFERVLRVNLAGTFLGTKHAARVMKPVRRGSIINTASTCSVVGGAASYAYTSSKHGLVGMMRNAAVELGQFGIRVNCVSPHLVLTPMAKSVLNLAKSVGMHSNLKGVDLEAEDIAAAALYLGSDESKFVSGVNLMIDGGFTVTNLGFSFYDITYLNSKKGKLILPDRRMWGWRPLYLASDESQYVSGA